MRVLLLLVRRVLRDFIVVRRADLESAMLTLEKRAHLEALHSGNVKESLMLEYKASPAIDKRDDSKKLEMARDVCAFANAEGGQIVYGMTEHEHEPAGLDEGIDGTLYPEIWFEQVLQQHITPPISRLRIRHVPLKSRWSRL